MLAEVIFSILAILAFCYALSAMPGIAHLPKGRHAKPNVKTSDLPYVDSMLQGKDKPR